MSSTRHTAKGPMIGEGRTAEVYLWGDGEVLKLYRAGYPAQWVDYEAKVARLVFEAGLGAPAVAGGRGRAVHAGGSRAAQSLTHS
jgi:hypothetical protein